MQNEKKSNSEFIPQFQKAFYHPRYWGVWLGTGLMAGISLVPARLRDPVLGAVGKLAGKVAKGARRRARINLLYCLPEVPENEREHIIDEMFATAPQSMILMAELACTKPEKVLKRVRWHGEEVLDKIREEGRNGNLMVPHGWAVDVPATMLR